jgi:hypothetical protein
MVGQRAVDEETKELFEAAFKEWFRRLRYL